MLTNQLNFPEGNGQHSIKKSNGSNEDILEEKKARFCGFVLSFIFAIFLLAGALGSYTYGRGVTLPNLLGALAFFGISLLCLFYRVNISKK